MNVTHSEEFLEKLYRQMLTIRLCEESLVEPILSGEVRCPCHLYSGQEAVAVGLCAALDSVDHIFGNHRSHGHYLAKGGSLEGLIAEIYGKASGCSRGRGGSMHLIANDCGMMGSVPIVAGTISLAVGSALAAVVRKEARISVSFFGDGATGEGALYEAMNFAALRKLPIIFVCENNLYATHMPIGDCRLDPNICTIADPLGIVNRQVDGNNVLAVFEAGKWAAELCRSGAGPVFLEFMTYRFRGHVGPDDNVQGCHTDIRPQTEVDAWLQKDPITSFERYLIENGLVRELRLNQIQEEVKQEVAYAFEKARQDTLPAESELMAYVFRA
jgi:acetoin:2,6-dichlorophenolindophenol oxidoreductase subunit alpha